MTLTEILMGIYREHGELTARLVVDAARPTQSPLHGRFEWDDDVAGDLYRLEQARGLIRSVKLRYGDESDLPSHHVRRFVNVAYRDDTPHATYMPTEEAMADDVTRQIVLRQMKREWVTFKRKYDAYVEFGELIRNEAESIGTEDAE